MSWLNEAVVETADEKQYKAQIALKQQLTNAVQRLLDTTAQQRTYDNMLSLCTYATSGNPRFAAEGQAGVRWRDEVWTRSVEILAEVERGVRLPPTEDELLSELPVFRWPD